jgi:Ca-activated chloride channel family protein
MTRRPLALAVLIVSLAAPAVAQSGVRPWAANVVVPQARSFRTAAGPSVVHVESVDAAIDVIEQVATTKLTIRLRNRSPRPQETELLVPVPAGVAVRSFRIGGEKDEAGAKLLPVAEARRLYASIVASLRDPGLLQFAGNAMLRTNVFPVPGNGKQTLRIVYEEILPADGARLDYVLPRTESLAYRAPWKITVRVKSKTPLATVYSPSHPIRSTRRGKGGFEVHVTRDGAQEPGPFQLSILRAAESVTASLFAYPEPADGGGAFLLLAGLPPIDKGAAKAIPREITLVIDRSGSMKRGKLDQVREAAAQILYGLRPGERFNLISYNATIDRFATAPVAKNMETLTGATAYLDALTPQGGTNLHDALVEALRQKPSEGHLPIVLFLTDGLPTVGEQSEVAIRKIAEDANPHRRRVFTIGVGLDVNTPLLDRIAVSTRARSTFILPGEDIEVKVGKVFRALEGPVLASPELVAVLPDGPARPRIVDVLPRTIPDLFEGTSSSCWGATGARRR